jgi:hypothetical protein
MDPLYTIHSVLCLDSEGERVASRFFEGPTSLKEQKAFEVSLLDDREKTETAC